MFRPMKRNEYIPPRVEVVKLTLESFTMASGLEDYEDNPIFGTPALGGTPEQFDVCGL